MDDARRAKYERLLGDTREEIKVLDEQVEVALAEIKQRLAELQSEKELHLEIYDRYCRLLGMPNDLAEDDEEDDEELED